MPSSRRTVSDSYSNQRSSPYPSSLSLSASTALNNSTRLRRAASGSETSSRRVLADIEWWRVTQGQQFHPESTDEMAPEEENNFHEMDVPLAGATVTIQEDLNFTRTITQAAEERRTTTLEAAFVLQDVFSTSDVSHEAGSLSSPFASLSIIDGMPQTPPRSRSASAASSTESTPEPSPRTPAMYSMRLSNSCDEEEYPSALGLGLGLKFDMTMDFGCSDISDVGLGDSELPAYLSSTLPRAFNARQILRSASLDSASFGLPKESSDDRFSDVFV